MSDSYFNVDLNDPRASAIAEVLSNKSCKAILALLAEQSEISEGEIAVKLGMPLNTVGYNMKKLVEAGFVEKSSGFFWSVKGKRVPKYHLANKKILIAPKKLFGTGVIASILVGVAVLIAFLYIVNNQNSYVGVSGEENGLKQFASVSEYKAFVDKYKSDSGNGGIFEESAGFAKATDSASAGASGSSGNEFSGTNVQVEGVDEADIIKSDGEYIYVLSSSAGRLYIVKAYPAENMSLLANISVGENAREMFLAGDKIVVVGSSWGYSPGIVGGLSAKIGMPCFGFGCGYSNSLTQVQVFDISDKNELKLETNASFNGNYLEARMIGDFVYLVSEESINSGSDVPIYTMNGLETSVPLENIRYDPNALSYVFTNIGVLNLENNGFEVNSYLTGNSEARYVSENNLYLSSRKEISQDYTNKRIVEEVYLNVLVGEGGEKVQTMLDNKEDYSKIVSTAQQYVSEYSNSLVGDEKKTFDSKLYENLQKVYSDIEKQRDTSVLHKFSLSDGEVSYVAKGEVSGHLLNQFSLDEFEGDLRVATTQGNLWEGKSKNNVYVLDEKMRVVGKIEGFAQGESIYSARFLGERAYLVTFKKTDPFYVIDLENAEAPKILGYLKIPGYSDYLHPYDENYVIGIGKDAVDAEQGSFAWYQGVKVALFDVRDVENPKEVGHVIIGDRGTDSLALHEHKAFLFDKKRNLLVLPITLAEINRNESYGYGDPNSAYGQTVWEGAYVLNVSEEGVSVRGRVSHSDKFEYGSSWIERSMFIEDVLYTLSGSKLQANELDSLEVIKQVEFGVPQYYGRWD